MRVAVLNGPNLNLLGVREPALYGHQTLGDIEAMVRAEAASLGVDLEWLHRNRQVVNICAAYLALGGNLALNVVLIPRQGIVGAAVATLLSYSAATSILLVLFLRESGMRWHDVLVLKPADLALWKRMAEHVWAGVRRRMPVRA